MEYIINQTTAPNTLRVVQNLLLITANKSLDELTTDMGVCLDTDSIDHIEESMCYELYDKYNIEVIYTV